MLAKGKGGLLPNYDLSLKKEVAKGGLISEFISIFGVGQKNLFKILDLFDSVLTI